MEKRKDLDKSETIFIDIDLHKRTWHVTIRTFEIELTSGSIPGSCKNLEPLLKSYSGHEEVLNRFLRDRSACSCSHPLQ